MKTKASPSKSDYGDDLLRKGARKKPGCTVAPGADLAINIAETAQQLRCFSRTATNLQYLENAPSADQLYKSLQRRRAKLIKQFRKTDKRPMRRDFWLLPAPPPGSQKGGGNSEGQYAYVPGLTPLTWGGYPERAQTEISWRDRLCYVMSGFRSAGYARPVLLVKSINHDSWYKNYMYWHNVSDGMILSRLELYDDAALLRDDNSDYIMVAQKLAWTGFKFACPGVLECRLRLHYNFDFKDDADDYANCRNSVALVATSDPNEEVEIGPGGGIDWGLEELTNESAVQVRGTFDIGKTIQIQQDTSYQIILYYMQFLAARDGLVTYEGGLDFLNPLTGLRSPPNLHYSFLPNND